MNKKLSLIAIISMMLAFTASADEGMWLPMLISQRISDMQAKGFKLTAEDIYSINKASLKDAVVLFGGGCTGELVSDEGLLLTNHHCGYSWIQKHSSVEHDYLKDGFWSKDRNGELPNKGLTVSFLVKMEEVTSRALQGYAEGMTEAQRDSLVKANSKIIEKEATADGIGLKASVEALYYGNQYFLFLYKVYKDVRLVAAPPSSIGKFGGDTDNWMWPRHTGDFSIFRVYADKNNEPAEYSADNVPFHPRKSFKISTSGVKEGDFTFIYGFPGSTREYIHSSEVNYISEISDPTKIALRTLRLNIMKKHMGESQAVRIQYSSKAASVSNAWKKWQGEAAGIRKMNTFNNKKAYEARFAKWAEGSRYEGLTDTLTALHAEKEPYQYAVDLYSETAYTCEIGRTAYSFYKSKKRSAESLSGFYKDYFLPIDKESFVAVMDAFDKKMPERMKPAYFKKTLASYGSVAAWAEDIFTNSAFVSADKAVTMVDAPDSVIAADPACKFYSEMYDWYVRDLYPALDDIRGRIDLAYRDYMAGQMEFEPDKCFYPDANLTLRVSYGKVAGYEPADGIRYKPVSTLKGVIEKDNPEIFDYNIPQTLRDVYARGGYDDQPVCFLAMNHTTGGNSGSPIINAEGNLLGLNFDRVWEGTQSDVVYDPDICRNISLDIRYLLFIVKEIGHADHLLKEMTFVD